MIVDPDIVAAAPDPELARVALERVGEAGGVVADPAVALVATRLLGFSTAAADFFVRHPEETLMLADVSRRGREALDAELAQEVTRRGPRDGLRLFRRRAMLRVAARDLAGAALEEVVAEISAVADACLERAVAEAAAPVPCAWRSIALGKLGGRELNYASDVDVLFAHDAGGRPRRGRARRRRSDRAAVRAHGRGHRAARGYDAPPGRPRWATEPRRGCRPRVLRATRGHLGAAGDDQGARGRRRSVAGLRVRGRRDAVRLPGSARAARDRRGAPHEGAPGGVHPTARQGAHRGQARPRRHPRRGVRGAAACRSCTVIATRACGTRTRCARSPRSRRRATWRRPTPTPSPTPTGSCGGSSTGCRWCGTCRRTISRPTRTRARRSRARSASPTPPRCSTSTSAPPARSAGSTSDSSTGRCWRPSPGRPT